MYSLDTSSVLPRAARKPYELTASSIHSFKAYPEEDKRDPEAYVGAINKLPKGSAVISTSCAIARPLVNADHRIPIVFTPDSTHFPIAMHALEQGHHVMVTKPATQHLKHHQALAKKAAEKGLVCWVEQ